MTRDARRPTERKKANESRRVAILSYAPEETIGFLVWDTVRAFHRTFQALVSEHGINFGLWPFLRALWTQDGIGIRELGQRVHMAAPTTLRAVLKLERFGLARRVQDKNDARKTLIFLSSKGRRLFSRVLPDIDYVNRMAVRGLSQREQNEVKRLLKHMRANMPKKQRPDVRI
jgi:MarR family transcriptional regulator, organic hydroperoxide resistance regulator